MKKIRFLFFNFVIMTSVLNTGCYSNWHDLDSFIAKITCDSSQEKVIEHAKLNLITHEWEKVHRVLSIYKNSDAIAVTFNNKGKLLSVTTSKSQIKLFGLYRNQATPVMSLNCQKPTKN